MFNDRLSIEDAMALGFDPSIDPKYAEWDEESLTIVYPKYVIENDQKIRLT